MKYTVVVNGERRTVDVPERMPLLWVLRDAMGLKGTKFGCGVAQCGACTVLIDGQPTRSCVTPIASVGTRAVTTIESLPRDGSHPLQRAWMELDVPQCGYCQAGQLMAASALLKATPNPTDAQIDTAMSRPPPAAAETCRNARRSSVGSFSVPAMASLSFRRSPPP